APFWVRDTTSSFIVASACSALLAANSEARCCSQALDRVPSVSISSTPLQVNDEVGRPNRPATPARQAVARTEPAPRKRSRRSGALGDTVPRRWGPVGPTADRQRRSSGDSRPDPDGMVEGSRAGFLERFAAFYAFLADLPRRGNCRAKWQALRWATAAICSRVGLASRCSSMYATTAQSRPRGSAPSGPRACDPPDRW